MKDVIILTKESVDLIYSEEFRRRYTSLVGTITSVGALRNMARDKELAIVELKKRGKLSPEVFPGEYIEVLEKRSDLPRSRRDVIEMIGNTVMGTLVPGGWEDVTGKQQS